MPSVIDKINYWAAPFVWKKKPADDMEVLWLQVQKPFEQTVPVVSDEAVANALVSDSRKWDHIEHIKEVRGKLIVDPRSGFLIDEDQKILQESIIFDHYGAYPHKLNLGSAKKTTVLPALALYDHYWSQNYFHFYSDIFPKLRLINEKAPHLKALPLVVSRKISETRAFKFFMQFPEAQAFNWYIQEPDEIIQTEKAYLLQPMPYARENWLWVKQLAAEYLKPFEPKKKIFINRPASTGRHIANFQELKPIIEAEGFEVVEMEKLSVPDQIALFSSAAVVASIHGAAMANLVFCDSRCKVLEITAGNSINAHYYWLASSLGLGKYDCLMGGNLEVKRILYPKGRFFLDPEKTKNYLRKISA